MIPLQRPPNATALDLDRDRQAREQQKRDEAATDAQSRDKAVAAERGKREQAEADLRQSRTELAAERRSRGEGHVPKFATGQRFKVFLPVNGCSIREIVDDLTSKFVERFGQDALAELKRLSGVDGPPLMTGYTLAACLGADLVSPAAAPSTATPPAATPAKTAQQISDQLWATHKQLSPSEKNTFFAANKSRMML